MRWPVRERGVRVVVDLARQQHPGLACVLVGDRDQHLPKRQARMQRLDPALLGRGPVATDGPRALQGAARTLDEQGAQVALAAAGDRAQARHAAAGVLRRRQSQPRGELPAVAELAAVADGGDQGIGR